MPETIDYPHDSAQERLIPFDAIREFLVNVLILKGMYEAEAEIGVDRILAADLRGIYSHGCIAVNRYLKAMDDGDIDPRASSITLNETPAMAIIDAGRGLGHVAATRGMQLAIKKANDVGTGTVVVKNGQHLGACSMYVLLAIEQGMIGYCTTSTGGATVAAYGSRQAAVANNAFAWGIPTREGPPLVLDMACAVSSWGKIEALKTYGLPIPEGWALDNNGSPTTNAADAQTLLPAAGARGYGLALVSSVLAGPLAGRRMPLQKTGTPEGNGSDHFFQAINIEHFAEPDHFHRHLDATISEIRKMEPSEGFDQVRLPGELEWEREEAAKINGIPLHRDHIEVLDRIAEENKIETTW